MGATRKRTRSCSGSMHDPNCLRPGQRSALTWIMRWLAFAGLPLVLPAGCGPLRTAYEPETSNPTPEVQRLVDRLERAIDNDDPEGVCRLYAFPARRCEAIWRDRIDALTLPVDLAATKLTGGCAGDVRVSLAKHPSLGDRLGTLTVVWLAQGPEGSKAMEAVRDLSWALPCSGEIRRGAYGIRTRAAAVRGRCPRPLDEWAVATAKCSGRLRRGFRARTALSGGRGRRCCERRRVGLAGVDCLLETAPDLLSRREQVVAGTAGRELQDAHRLVSSTVTARIGGCLVERPQAVDLPPERHERSLPAIGRTGKPPGPARSAVCARNRGSAQYQGLHDHGLQSRPDRTKYR